MIALTQDQIKYIKENLSSVAYPSHDWVLGLLATLADRDRELATERHTRLSETSQHDAIQRFQLGECTRLTRELADVTASHQRANAQIAMWEGLYDLYDGDNDTDIIQAARDTHRQLAEAHAKTKRERDQFSRDLFNEAAENKILRRKIDTANYDNAQRLADATNAAVRLRTALMAVRVRIGTAILVSGRSDWGGVKWGERLTLIDKAVDAFAPSTDAHSHTERDQDGADFQEHSAHDFMAHPEEAFLPHIATPEHVAAPAQSLEETLVQSLAASEHDYVWRKSRASGLEAGKGGDDA